MAGEVVELDIAMDISWGYGDGGRARRGLSSNRWCACESWLVMEVSQLLTKLPVEDKCHGKHQNCKRPILGNPTTQPHRRGGVPAGPALPCAAAYTH